MRNWIIAAIGAGILAACSTSQPPPPPKAVEAPVRLTPDKPPRTSLAELAQASDAYTTSVFGSVEIRVADDRLEQRSDANLVVQWGRILTWMRDQDGNFRACNARAEYCGGDEQRRWRTMIVSARELPLTGQLHSVNGFFNQWPYLSDEAVYRTTDHWATPFEFMRRSGDCEDFSIAKFMALRQLGVANDKLRIVVLTDQIRRTIHAVLAVYVAGDILILDSLSDGIYSHRTYRQYIPHFSLNETGVWEHHGRTVMPVAQGLPDFPMLACVAPPIGAPPA